MNRRSRMIHQTATSDCAPACLAMVADHHRAGTGLTGLRELLDPGRDGVSVRVLRDTAREIGLQAEAIRIDTHDLANHTPPLPTPFIAHGKNLHYMVVEKVTARRVRVADPAVGRRSLSPAQFDQWASGIAVVVAAQQSTTPRPQPRPQVSIATVLRPLLARHRRTLALAMLLSAVMTLLGFSAPYATAQITDMIALGSDGVSWWLVAAAAAGLGMAAAALGRALVSAAVQRDLSRDLGTDVAGALFSRTYRYHERRTLGDLFQRVNSAMVVHHLLSVVLIGAVLDSVLALGYLVALLVWAPTLAAWTAALLLLTVAAALALARRSATIGREELLLASDADSLLVDALSGFDGVRSAGAEAEVLDRWTTRMALRLDAGARRARAAGLTETLLAAIRVAAPIGLLVIAASHAPTPGVAIGLAALAGAVLAPLSSLAQAAVMAADLRPQLERIVDVAEAPAETAGTPLTGRLTGDIELDGVDFRYDARSPLAVDGVTCRIRAGAKVGVVGATGCGKSTLLSLLTGLHDPTSGTIRYGGQDLAGLDRTSVRRQLGVVHQDTWLGVGTIRDAVTFGRNGVDDQAVYQALARACVLEEVLAMPNQLDTDLGNGHTLSTGQRQRIALARALVNDPAILLLDEATSALDVGTEARVEDELRRTEVTRVVVAHRLSTVADADWLLVMDSGHVVEQGTPAELLNRGGRYAEMVASATAPRELEPA